MKRTYMTIPRAQKLDDMSRPVKIHCCKDGTISYRVPPEPVFNGVALPVFSVDTVEEAKALQLLCCRRQYEEHPLMRGRPWFRIGVDDFPPILEIQHLDAVTDSLRRRYAMIKSRSTT